MFKIQWHEDLSFSDKVWRTLACIFGSGCSAFLIANTIYIFCRFFPRINIFTIVLFIVFFYFSFKKIKTLPLPDNNVMCPQPEEHSFCDINNPSNPYAYTTPGGIGYRPIETGLEHFNRSNPFADLDNYNKHF